MRESEPNPLESRRLELIERIGTESVELGGLDPKSPKAKHLKLSIGHLQHDLDEIEKGLGIITKHAA